MSDQDRAASLDSQITDLYDRLAKKPVARASFGIPGLLPGMSGPTGYALVFKQLEEARQALELNQMAVAERITREAHTQFDWCEDNVHWITDRVERFSRASVGGSIGRLLTPLTCLPRWVFLLGYLAAWIGAVGGVANARSDWELVSVPVTFLFWGTLGGATAGIFGVWIHIVRSDFDPKYIPWYVAKPFIGGIAGALVFILGDSISPEELSNATGFTLGDSISPEQSSEATGFKVTEAALFVSAFVLGFFESLFISVMEILRLKIRDVVNVVLGRPTERTQA